MGEISYKNQHSGSYGCLTALMASKIESSSAFLFWSSSWKPGALLVMLSMSDEKKAASKFSLKAISWKAVKLLLASFGGGGAFDSWPPAVCWIAASCSGLGLGKPSLAGVL